MIFSHGIQIAYVTLSLPHVHCDKNVAFVKILTRFLIKPLLEESELIECDLSFSCENQQKAFYKIIKDCFLTKMNSEKEECSQKMATKGDC